jgi:ABC-type oligopeptide transport system substrate-binding subunit
MKRFFIVLLAVALLFGCGSSKEINGKECETYGFINKDQVYDPDIRYKVITGNVVWGIILAETIVAPVYFFGFSLYEPVEAK